MTSLDRVLQVARGQLGYYRKPGTNTKFGEWYAREVGNKVYNNAQYCAMFVSWVAWQANVLGVAYPLHAYTPTGANWFRSKGRWVDGTKGVKPGDLVYFKFPGMNRISHVGIVESVEADSVVTIEGNTSGTSGGDQRNSGLVARKRRKSYIVGYGKAYLKPTATPEASKESTPGKSIAQLAEEVIAGKHGSGADRRKALGALYGPVQDVVNRKLQEQKITPKALDTLAKEVIDGKHGSGDARRKSLGVRYSEVQKRVNELLGAGGPFVNKTTGQLALEVIAGKHGSGEARRKALGVRYSEVQKRVNALLKG